MHANEKIYNFNIFRRLADLTRSIYYGDITIKQAKSRQGEMESLITSLSRYNPKNKDKIKNKKETLNNAEKIFYARELIINAFEDGIFPLPNKPQEWSEKKETYKKSYKKERATDDVKEFCYSIIDKEIGINRELLKEYFNFQAPIFMLRDLVHTNDKNNTLVNVIKSGLKILKEEIG